MKKLLTVFIAGCAYVYTPPDLIPRGTYCQPLSESVRRCTTPEGSIWFCHDNFGRWRCEARH